MDRMYKNPEWVNVYETDRVGPPLDSFRQRPYSCYGFDNFKYKGTTYKGFTFEGQTYILLSEPLFKETA